MLDAILGVATSGTSGIIGGVFGGLLSWAKGWQENRHELKLIELQLQEKSKDREHDLAVMDREATSAEKLALIRSEGELNVAEMSAMAEAIKAEARGATWSKGVIGTLSGFWASLAGFLLTLVDVVRGLIRPVLTLYLVGLVTAIFLRVWSQSTGFDADQNFTLIIRIVDMVLFLTCTAVGFWFGSRGTSKKPA